MTHIYRVFQYSKKIKPENFGSQVKYEIIQLILLAQFLTATVYLERAHPGFNASNFLMRVG